MQTVLERSYPGTNINGKRNGAPKPVCWTVDEYYQMYNAGLFKGKRVQLIRGEIIEMAPMLSPHATSVLLVLDRLQEVFQTRFFVRPQLPMSFSRFDEPEPDAAVVEGSVRDYAEAHPNSAVLIVEVADTSLRFDRTKKAVLYAENGIEDYWIVNLRKRCLEVYRRPVHDESLGFIYSEHFIVEEEETVSPIAKPRAKIKVADILP